MVSACVSIKRGTAATDFRKERCDGVPRNPFRGPQHPVRVVDVKLTGNAGRTVFSYISEKDVFKLNFVHFNKRLIPRVQKAACP